MKKLFIFLFLLISGAAHAQQTIGIVYNGLPLSSTNPLPSTVYGGTSGYCLTSNGAGNAATFQTCGGAGVLSLVNGGTGIIATTGYVQAWPNKRVPTSTDDTTKGYSINQFWNYNGQQWLTTAVGSGTANWQNQSSLSAAVCDLVASCTGAYGVYKLRTAYAGNAFNITRASDSGTLAIAFDVNGIASWAAVDAFCVGTTCTVNTWYDQSGNANDLTQATAANQPRIWDGKVGNFRSISFDGENAVKTLSNTALSITNRQNATVLFVGKVEGNMGNTGGALWELGAPTQALTLLTNSFSSALLSYDTGQKFFTKYLRGESPQSILYVDNAGAESIYQNNDKSTAGTIASGAATGLRVGSSSLGSFPGSFDIAALVVWNSSLSAANQLIVQQSSYATTNVQPQVNDNIVLTGDSITCCTISSGGAPDMNYAGQLPLILDHPFNYYNFGNGGGLLSSFVTNISTYAPVTFVSGATNIGVIFGGTNDIATGTTVTGANLYTYAQTGCTNYHAAGYKCVVASLLPRNSFSGGQNSAGFETARQAYETLLVAGWPSFADGFIDLTADPVIGPQAAASNAALFSDSIHPTILGASYVSSAFARGLKPLIQ